MANTYTELQYHCIWTTKRRESLIRPEIEKRVWKILAATALRHGMKINRVGGIENHVHILVQIPKTMTVSEAMKQLKGGSSNDINKENFFGGAHFSWQTGYAAFTVSTSKAASVAKYIANQREHHRGQTFEDELKEFLDKHGVDYDSRYLLD